ncbi:DNA translocase FtsK [Sporosarcina sp. YIM B06819]|uniref:DNA translocase FtsK n=1 Tax=Sporosarcina sp. YIM B06819 TaxID=3081769 RepID=UPI00298C49C1|nr:DNA translocase FtsK [Sporosarcina sp. YIM B06819]
MSWFNTLMNRLFGPDDNSKEEVVYEESKNDYEVDEAVEQLERRQASSFRFPIVSDAEIYGWDEEPSKERQVPQPAANHTDADDDYEPTPLYENDRWQGDPTVSNVFRAGSTPKYGTASVPKTTIFGSDEEEYREKQPAQVKAPIQKRSSRPFSPTSVPSPVYGYKNPRKEVSSIPDEEDMKLSQLEEAVIPIESVIYEDNAVQQQFAHADEDEQLTIVQPIMEFPVIASDTVDDKVDVVDETYQTTVELPVTEPDKRDNELDVVEVNSTVIEPLEMAHTNDSFPKVKEEVFVEQTDLPEQPVIEQPVPEQKKERIVPFNVLMLKSDKEKITRDYPLAAKLDTSIKMNEPIAPAPVFRVVEEVSQEVPEQPSDDEHIDEQPYYAFPSLDYLIPPEAQIEDSEWLESQSEKLEEALSHFAVQATVIEAVQGPTVTRFELTVGQGTKVSKVRNLTDDLKLALAAEDIRIQAPIPGRSSIGIEIPNRKTRAVRISEVIATDSFEASTSPLEAVLGLSLTGTPVTLDLRKMPHGMIAGATGSGKSVCINSILVSLLYKATPTDLKMMLIDPKMVELAPFNGIPHLISPVITDVKAATAALKWAVAEMERRYELLAHSGVRDIERYNKLVMDSRRFSLKMPYLLIVIDELADLMMMAPADVEVSISRIAQKARACGIHLIIATQRPSVDVITGTIKANIPTRIAFSVSSQIDSRTIIDSPGAERLLGKGDMLYIGNGQSAGVRLQGTFVTDDEIERIIEHVRNEAAPDYLFGQDDLLASAVEEEETDPLFEEVCLFVHEQGSASTSLLQRNFSIGYNRAAKLIDRMEKHGFISGQRGSKARDVFLTESDLDRLTERLE